MVVRLLTGDVMDHLQAMEADSVDACVTDPPYGLGFMGKTWDHGVPGELYWREVLRVLKPGGYLLAFGGTRTYHRLTCAIEDAGFEIRDCLMWLYSQGFPKGRNLGCTCRRVGTTIPYDHMGRAATPESPSEYDVRPVSEADLPAALDADDQRGEVLLTGMSECGSPIEGAATLGTAPLWPGQPRLEGRGDVQALEGQLHRPEVRQVSSGVPADGAQGRLHHGASARDGEEARPSPDTNGSGPPHRPQHAEQRPVESGVVRQQRRPQTSRGGTCEGCGGLLDFQGWNTTLKPAWEPIILARKPHTGSIAANVACYGTGGLNIDACRIDYEVGGTVATNPSLRTQIAGGNGGHIFAHEEERRFSTPNLDGRWPANVVLSHEDGCREVGTKRVKASGGGLSTNALGRMNDDGWQDRPYPITRPSPTVAAWECVPECAVRLLDEQTGTLTSNSGKPFNRHADKFRATYGDFQGRAAEDGFYGDTGAASRFFYCAKASPSERGAFNDHPTVKPLALMRWLIRLVTPPGGTVLDPFCGSGSTLIAADREGFDAIGIDQDEHAIEIARRRLSEDAGLFAEVVS